MKQIVIDNAYARIYLLYICKYFNKIWLLSNFICCRSQHIIWWRLKKKRTNSDQIIQNEKKNTNYLLTSWLRLNDRLSALFYVCSFYFWPSILSIWQFKINQRKFKAIIFIDIPYSRWSSTTVNLIIKSWCFIYLNQYFIPLKLNSNINKTVYCLWNLYLVNERIEYDIMGAHFVTSPSIYPIQYKNTRKCEKNEWKTISAMFIEHLHIFQYMRCWWCMLFYHNLHVSFVDLFFLPFVISFYYLFWNIYYLQRFFLFYRSVIHLLIYSFFLVHLPHSIKFPL